MGDDQRPPRHRPVPPRFNVLWGSYGPVPLEAGARSAVRLVSRFFRGLPRRATGLWPATGRARVLAMQGLMQDYPLTLVSILERAERMFADKTVVTATAVGVERLRYGDWADRTPPLAGAP